MRSGMRCQKSAVCELDLALKRYRQRGISLMIRSFGQMRPLCIRGGVKPDGLPRASKPVQIARLDISALAAARRREAGVPPAVTMAPRFTEAAATCSSVEPASG